MNDGIQLNPEVLQQVQASKISEQAIHITQLEAAVQQLLMEGQAMNNKIKELEEQLPTDTVAEVEQEG